MYKGAKQNYSQHWLELVKYLDSIKLDIKNIHRKSGQSISIFPAGDRLQYWLLNPWLQSGDQSHKANSWNMSFVIVVG